MIEGNILLKKTGENTTNSFNHFNHCIRSNASTKKTGEILFPIQKRKFDRCGKEVDSQPALNLVS